MSYTPALVAFEILPGESKRGKGRGKSAELTRTLQKWRDWIAKGEYMTFATYVSPCHEDDL